MNEIICGKAENILQFFDGGTFDLIITSPPYDGLRDYKGYSLDFPLLVTQLYRTIKNGGVLVWVVGDQTIKGSETGSSFGQALSFMDMGFNLHDTMIYEKAGNLPTKNRYVQAFEFMFIFCKGKPKSINLIKDKQNKWAGQSTFGVSSFRMKNGEIKPSKKRIIQKYGIRTNIWRYANGFGFGQSNKLAYKHPATFPEKLAEDHIISWSVEGDIVLDPMCGSGTVLRMAKKTNRNYIGIDISEEYCQLSKRLLEAT